MKYTIYFIHFKFYENYFYSPTAQCNYTSEKGPSLLKLYFIFMDRHYELADLDGRFDF